MPPAPHPPPSTPNSAFKSFISILDRCEVICLRDAGDTSGSEFLAYPVCLPYVTGIRAFARCCLMGVSDKGVVMMLLGACGGGRRVPANEGKRLLATKLIGVNNYGVTHNTALGARINRQR